MKKLMLITLFFGAITTYGQTEKQMKAQMLKEFTHNYGAAAAKKMINNEVWIGMTDKMCLDEFTSPNSKKTTYTAEGKSEVWVYQGRAEGCIGSGCPYLDYIITFRNHKAVAITTSE